MEYYGCELIANMYLNFNGRIDIDNDTALSICCECNLPAPAPGIALKDNPEETLQRFIGMRSILLAEGLRKDKNISKNDLLYPCKHCIHYKKINVTPSLNINYINLSMYPSPCQCKCIYCEVHKKWDNSLKVQEAYDKLFNILEYGKEHGIISPDATWQISCGEITIHPYRKRIMDLVVGQTVVFYTNCFKFDEDIAKNLHDNPKSYINLSIDAGTPETWKKVKGFDNFEEVTSNLVKYHVNCARPGKQITFKYIILPGINDSIEDYLSLMEIMKVLKLKHLTLSFDTRTKYKEKNNNLIESAALLLVICSQNNITTDMFHFSYEQKIEIINLAKQIVQNNMD